MADFLIPFTEAELEGTINAIERAIGDYEAPGQDWWEWKATLERLKTYLAK